jgi:hypothetical protein
MQIKRDLALPSKQECIAKSFFTGISFYGNFFSFLKKRNKKLSYKSFCQEFFRFAKQMAAICRQEKSRRFA